jgi:hypothetical protein
MANCTSYLAEQDSSSKPGNDKDLPFNTKLKVSTKQERRHVKATKKGLPSSALGCHQPHWGYWSPRVGRLSVTTVSPFYKGQLRLVTSGFRPFSGPQSQFKAYRPQQKGSGLWFCPCDRGSPAPQSLPRGHCQPHSGEG